MVTRRDANRGDRRRDERRRGLCHPGPRRERHRPDGRHRAHRHLSESRASGVLRLLDTRRPAGHVPDARARQPRPARRSGRRQHPRRGHPRGQPALLGLGRLCPGARECRRRRAWSVSRRDRPRRGGGDAGRDQTWLLPVASRNPRRNASGVRCCQRRVGRRRSSSSRATAPTDTKSRCQAWRQSALHLPATTWRSSPRKRRARRSGCPSARFVSSTSHRAPSERSRAGRSWGSSGRRTARRSRRFGSQGPATTKSRRSETPFPPSSSHRPRPRTGYTLHLAFVDVASGSVRSKRDVRVSEKFALQLLPYFDQYALSHRFWSPDSASFMLPLVSEDDVVGIVLLPPDGSAERAGRRRRDGILQPVTSPMPAT